MDKVDKQVTVGWQASVGTCDFCLSPMEQSQVRPVLTGLSLGMFDHQHKEFLVFNGPFVLCDACRQRLNLTDSQSEIGIKAVSEVYQAILGELVTLRINLSRSIN